MKKMTLSSGRALAAFALSATLAASPEAFAQFNQTGAGPYDYNDTANWNGGTINNQFSSNPTANQTVFFAEDTTLSSGWSISNTGTFSRTFIGSGADRTVTLGGNFFLGSSNDNANTVTIGSTTAGQELNLDLGGATRTVTVNTNRTLEILNEISGSGGIIKNGPGTMRLTGTANTFTGGMVIGGGSPSAFGGVLEVMKIADSGQASSVGAGDRITFGGINGAATLRYLGSGDSSNRVFTIGSQGAIIDASGSGALQFTKTNPVSWGSTNISPVITLTGTNQGDNLFSAAIGNNGTTGQPNVAKTGSGKWILEGVHTYTGTTTVTEGTLVIDGSLGDTITVVDGGTLIVNGSIANTTTTVNAGTLIINGSITSTTTVNGGLLGGNGTTGTVIVNDAGAIGAGNSIGTLTTGNLTLNDSAEFVFEYNITSPNTVTADLINADSFSLDLENTAVLTVSNLGLDVALEIGTVLTLVDYTTWNGGMFLNRPDDSTFTVGANTFRISYNGVSGSDTAVTLEVVPEPTSVLLAGLGLATALFGMRRRVS
jgi:fibronectin-binding autotransporter adhesin